ncbi:uncharacterized protein BDZ99DRAFT_514930 [Mytilinidion resinicola]|uniref:Uncharacterized protein n=1 Tax=Mytilinidion resinicola TaxID=574789 RepID=A0A6A6Z5G4_9PEZI|nr:uncharacterized protein BDZ99DRAFT_514930 [Mytilinidion resinicola]KAF2816336.1 hypothetical protein BDZ99DRAFT_514930 [Mytilinidion resinicola]
MTAVMTMGGGLAPASRHDIISTLLNDYGSSWENGGSSPYAVSPVRDLPPLPSIKDLPPPPPKDDKPLPYFMRFQLRVDEASTKPPTQQEPTIIHSKSISRGRKPNNLKLAISNGATAVLPSTQLTNASSTTAAHTPQLSDRPLPGLPDLPPPPPRKSSLRPQMGNKDSKVANDKEEKATSPKGSVFKRRPVPAPKVPGVKKYPTLGDTLSRTGLKHKKLVDRGSLVDQQSTADQRSIAASTSPSTIPSHAQTRSNATDYSSTTPTNVTSLAGTSRAGTSTATGRTGSTSIDTNGPPTPEPRTSLVPSLPSPSPVPEESPSKYGLRDRSPSPKAGPPPVSKHYRGKSSTGFDIFKASSGLQNARAYLNTITPSPTPSPIVTPIASVMNTTTQSQETSEDEPLYSPRSPKIQELRRKRSSILLSLNENRPATCNAPYLTVTHTDCYHNHAHFHPGKNTACPVACMLCYKDEPSERWTCTWCALRICSGCRANLERVPSRNICALKNSNFSTKDSRTRSRVSSGPGVVLWESKMEKVRK